MDCLNGRKKVLLLASCMSYTLKSSLSISILESRGASLFKFLRQNSAALIILIALTGAGAFAAQRNADWVWLVIPTGRRLGLLARSLALCGGTAMIDLALGVMIASAFWNWGKRFTWVRWLPLVMGVLPPYIQALAWENFFQWLPYRPSGEWLAGGVMAMAYLPVGIGLAFLSLDTVARVPVEAARLWRSDLAVVQRVLLPLAAPLLAAGGVFLFLINLMDYSVPSLFGVNVYSLEIFAEYSASSQPGRAFLLSLPLVGLAALLLPLLQRVVRFAAQGQSAGPSPWQVKPTWPAWFAALQWAALAVWALQVGAPFVSLLSLSVAGGGMSELFLPASRDLGFSFGVAASAALLSLPLGWAVLRLLRAGHRLQWLAVLPLAIPAPLIGAGLAAIFNQPWLKGIYDSAWMPVLAGLARFTPLAVLALAAQASRVDPLLLDAACLFQKIRWQGFFQVRLPLMAPGMIAAACLVFALTLGELGATLIVIPPGQNSLSLRIYNYLHYGASDVVAGLCLVVLALTLAAGGTAAVALAAVGRWTGRQRAEEES
jgi:iron(III) transport system permease protein